MKTSRKAIAALIFRILGLLISTTGIIMHLIEGRFAPAGFMIRHKLAYFTIQTNVMIALLFAFLIVRTLVCSEKRGRLVLIRIRPSFQLALTLYITITMLGFWTLLAPSSGIPKNPVLFLSSLILHTVTPLMAICDFIFFGRRRRIPKTDVFRWLSYPVCYLIFVLIYSRTISAPYYTFTVKGYSVDLMYPYPFLEPAIMGVRGVIIAVTVLAVLFTLLGLLMILIHNHFSRDPVQKLPG